MPAQPIATSHCPWRQARPKLSVISTAGDAPVSSRRRARKAPRRGVGVAGEQDQRLGPVLPSGVGGVDPGVGADEAVVGAADEHAVRGAEDLRGLVEHDLHRARVLVLLRRQLARSRTGLDVGEGDDCALGLRDDLVRDHDDLPVVQGAAPAVARRAAAWRINLAEVIAGAHLGQAAEAPVRKALRLRATGPCALRPGPSTARVAASSMRSPDRRARSAARSSPVSMSSSSEAGRSMRQRHSAVARERAVALAAVGAEAGGDGVGGHEQQTVGAGSVTVGDDHDLGGLSRLLAMGCARAVPSSSMGSSVGQSPGMHSTRSIPSREGARDAERDRGALAVLR